MKIAVIPARGGSKRIPRKNILSFGGQPMIAYAIKAACASGCFDKVVVSTDDAEIAVLARSLGALTPFIRPAFLSDDHTPTVPVIAHAIEACEQEGWLPYEVCCIYPSVPFLEPSDIFLAWHLLQLSSAQYAFPVTPFNSPIQRALTRDAQGATRPFYPEFSATRTQDLVEGYHDAGQFYWGRRDAWLAGQNIHLNGASIVIPSWRVVDIDTPEDWHRAELLHRALAVQSIQ